jgi:hypothetical protein
MPTTPEQIDEYFAKLDWPFSKREPTLWDSGYIGENFRVRFIVRLTERWLYVNALLPAKIHADCRPNLYEHLLRLNFVLNGVKLFLDGDDDVTLAMELPASAVSLEDFETALYAVCSNADRHFVELIRLATDPTAVSSQKPGQTPETPATPGVDWSGDGSGTDNTPPETQG